MSSSGVTTSIASNGIVVDVLNRENYSSWKVLVKNYLMGNDLWYNIIKDDKKCEIKEQPAPKEDKSDSEDNKEGEGEEQQHPKEGEIKQPPSKEDKDDTKAKSVEEYRRKKPKEWEMKNRRALHAIQLSCGKTIGQIKNFRIAKEAWDHLETSFREDIKAYRSSLSSQTRSTAGPDYEREFRECVKKGSLQRVKVAINVSPDYIFSTSSDGRTALHIAVVMGHEDIIKMLISVGKKQLLEMRDKNGYTALALAAELTDNKDIAQIMVENGREELLIMTSHKEKEKIHKDEDEDEEEEEEEEEEDEDEDGVDDEIPVLLASAKGHKNMTRYLFGKTPLNFLRKDNWKYGVVLLARCISNEIFDVAAEIIRHDDEQEIPLNHHKKKYLRPIYALAHKPSAFPSALKHDLSWWKRFICDSILTLSVKDLNNEKIAIVFHEPEDIERQTTLPGRLFGRLQQYVQTSILLKFDDFRELYEKKMDRYHVREILDYLCKRISILLEEEVDRTSANDAMLQAAKYGITEFIDSMKDASPDLLLVRDKSNRGILAHAVLNRQEGVFQLINDDVENKEMITSDEDTLKYNLLHIAAELGPSSYLDRISNAALQMQRELQWFQEVKNVVPQWCYNAKDPNGKTAREVFTDEHKELLKSGQQWAKDTATSFTLIGTLIITIMFAAAFAVPGGTNDKNGIPVILDEKENVFRKSMFNFFVISVAVSLVTSSSSVLVFIGILTSRYSEQDFLKSLPLKLLFGLVTLFLSVAAMMCAFIAGLDVMLEGYRRVVIAAMWLAFLPILVFVPPLVRLVSEIFLSTVRSCKLAASDRRKRIIRIN